MAMWTQGRAPAANDPPDRPGLDLADAIERIADTLYGCADKAAEMTSHQASYCGADPLLAKLRAVVEEIRNVTGG